MKTSKWLRVTITSPLPDAPADRYVWGYANAPIGGVNPRIGSTVQRSDRLARGAFPFHPGKNVSTADCTTRRARIWSSSLLPAPTAEKTAWSTGDLTTITAGVVCAVRKSAPPNALVTALEKDYPKTAFSSESASAARRHPRYQTVGANSWITSDSFTDESGSTEASYKCRQHRRIVPAHNPCGMENDMEK